jgi:hypothetical protein
MKILLIIHGFPPQQSTGSEIYTWMLANQLSNKDDVTVLTRTNNLSVGVIMHPGAECDNIKMQDA